MGGCRGCDRVADVWRAPFFSDTVEAAVILVIAVMK